jgi:hypothetical protein
VDLRKDIVLVSLIVGVDGWGRMISLKKEKALEKSREQPKRLRQNSGIFLEQSRWQHLYLNQIKLDLSLYLILSSMRLRSQSISITM